MSARYELWYTDTLISAGSLDEVVEFIKDNCPIKPDERQLRQAMELGDEFKYYSKLYHLKKVKEKDATK